MTNTDSTFAGSIPELYDTHLVPLIFQRYADDLAAAVAARKPRDVLETACGTGVVTRAAVRALGPGVRYVATDLNEAMIDRARARQPAGDRVDWRQADALALPFADDGFDVVLCQFGVMFFPDKVAGFAEARRVLRPGGAFLFNAWDRIDTSPLTEEVTRVVGEMFPEDPPMFLARTPHGYHDPDRIRADLAAAGFDDISVEHVEHLAHAENTATVASAFVTGTPLRNEIEARDAARLDEAEARVTAALVQLYGPGPLEARLSALVASAVA